MDNLNWLVLISSSSVWFFNTSVSNRLRQMLVVRGHFLIHQVFIIGFYFRIFFSKRRDFGS
ncbi:hypothetical protein mO188R [Vaccinia virus]|uniref:Uncharacterized protein n=4 Tax=Vaccinia virus TaxID=10245 RepID=M9WEH7_VACCV|nr:TA30R [Vaccinia virus Tian Tan]AAW23578.1 hypothetical protein m8188R [Vaccinia virus]ABZ80102.1 hypothetical protein GL200 [synthetic Vaccinia virus]AAW23860.1 hypothetical protein mO188R [Vaccinia virus]AGJ91340.1 hypothetical protein VACV_TT8_190 [Vaccinia virus]